jgi:hypothetical protein
MKENTVYLDNRDIEIGRTDTNNHMYLAEPGLSGLSPVSPDNWKKLWNVDWEYLVYIADGDLKKAAKKVSFD